MNKNSRVGLAVCSVLAIAVSLVSLFNPWAKTAGERNIKQARHVMADGVARKVAERYPGGRIAVLVNAETSRDDTTMNGFDELTALLLKALKNQDLIVTSMPCRVIQPETLYESAKAEPSGEDLNPDAETDLMEEQSQQRGDEIATVDSGSLIRLLGELNGRVDAVILTVPLNDSIGPQDLPRKGQAPPLVLMNPPGWQDLSSAMEDTALDVVLLYRTKISHLVTKKWPKDDALAFDQRFFFATAAMAPAQNLPERQRE